MFREPEARNAKAKAISVSSVWLRQHLEKGSPLISEVTFDARRILLGAQ